MKNWKDLLYGILSAVGLAAQVGWEWVVKWWATRSSAQQSVLIAVVIVLVALGGWRVAHAENTPGSNFGVINSLSTPGTAFACYLSDGEAEMTGGIVHTCLVLQMVGPGILATFGNVTFCTMSGMYKSKPKWSCGKYEDMYKLSMGV